MFAGRPTGSPFSTAALDRTRCQTVALGEEYAVDKRFYTSRVAFAGGLASLLLGLWQVILMLMYLYHQSSANQYLDNNNYIPAVLYFFTVAYLAVNATVGGMSVYYAREYGDGTALFVLASVCLVLKANTCIFVDLIAIDFIRRTGSYDWSYILTAVLNAVPVIIITCGAVQKRKLFKRYPLTDI